MRLGPEASRDRKNTRRRLLVSRGPAAAACRVATAAELLGNRGFPTPDQRRALSAGGLAERAGGGELEEADGGESEERPRHMNRTREKAISFPG